MLLLGRWGGEGAFLSGRASRARASLSVFPSLGGRAAPLPSLLSPLSRPTHPCSRQYSSQQELPTWMPARQEWEREGGGGVRERGAGGERAARAAAARENGGGARRRARSLALGRPHPQGHASAPRPSPPLREGRQGDLPRRPRGLHRARGAGRGPGGVAKARPPQTAARFFFASLPPPPTGEGGRGRRNVSSRRKRGGQRRGAGVTRPATSLPTPSPRPGGGGRARCVEGRPAGGRGRARCGREWRALPLARAKTRKMGARFFVCGPSQALATTPTHRPGRCGRR